VSAPWPVMGKKVESNKTTSQGSDLKDKSEKLERRNTLRLMIGNIFAIRLRVDDLRAIESKGSRADPKSDDNLFVYVLCKSLSFS
jgi:hypothetical protein